MAYRQIYYHIIFRTKSSEKVLTKEKLPELFKYIWGIVNAKNCHLYRINGLDEHIHFSSDLHPMVCLADYMRDIKTSSSLWLKENNIFPYFRGWAEGYCAVTYGHADKDRVINYIKNQEVHHKKETFKEEYHRLMEESGIKKR